MALILTYSIYFSFQIGDVYRDISLTEYTFLNSFLSLGCLLTLMPLTFETKIWLLNSLNRDIGTGELWKSCSNFYLSKIIQYIGIKQTCPSSKHRYLWSFFWYRTASFFFWYRTTWTKHRFSLSWRRGFQELHLAWKKLWAEPSKYDIITLKVI